MSYLKPFFLAAMCCSLVFFTGCKKWNFERRLAGGYSGVWTKQIMKDSVLTTQELPRVVIVGNYDKGDKVFYIDQEAFTYGSSNIYEKNTGYPFYSDYKATFKPKEDSLILYVRTSSRSEATFRGKRP